MELMLKEKSITRETDLFIGIAKFDEIEGPIIYLIYPPSYPIDIHDNYIIADHSLHIQTTSYFELNEYGIISIPVTIRSNEAPRGVKYYSIIIGTKKHTNINLSKHIDDIKIIANELLIDNKELFINENLQPFLRELYYAIYKLIYQHAENINYNKIQDSIQNKYTDDFTNTPRIILVDKIYGIILTEYPELLAKLDALAENIRIINTPRYLILIYAGM